MTIAKSSSADLPIACSLDAGALAGRQAELRGGVLAEAESVERLPDGYRWRFRGGRDLLARLGSVIDAERHCCRFLRFAIEVEPDLSAVVVDVTGPNGTVEFLEGWTTVR
jgi:hypothetical protein